MSGGEDEEACSFIPSGGELIGVFYAQNRDELDELAVQVDNLAIPRHTGTSTR